MFGRIRAAFRPTLEVVVQPNRVSVRNLASGSFATADAPFSCSHLMADSAEILEHTCNRLFMETADPLSRFFAFPTVRVSTAGRTIHALERETIRNALLNCGASKVIFEPPVQVCEEQASRRTDYVKRASRKP